MRLRFGGVCGKCVVMLPCKNELNRRGSRFGSDSKVYKCSLSWNRLITQTDDVGFHSKLVWDMCTMCAIYPVNMSSIGGGLRFGGNSKVYKCSLSWNQSITWTNGNGF